MQKIIIAIALLFTINAKAQIQKIDLQATGLTCSMCNKSIYKSLATLQNIDTIVADLNTNIFTLTFKKDNDINIDAIKQKVEAAGYKIGLLWVTANFTDLAIKNDTHIAISNTNFHFLKVKEQTLSGIQKVQLVDKGYVTSKQLKKWEKATTMQCYKTGYMESCCTKDVGEKKRIYHITI